MQFPPQQTKCKQMCVFQLYRPSSAFWTRPDLQTVSSETNPDLHGEPEKVHQNQLFCESPQHQHQRTTATAGDLPTAENMFCTVTSETTSDYNQRSSSYHTHTRCLVWPERLSVLWWCWLINQNQQHTERSEFTTTLNCQHVCVSAAVR